MSLRIRQVKPSFWSDAKLIRIPLDVRCFYVGMWQASDDAGWFEWEPEQIAVDLHLREPFVRRAMAVLVSFDRVVLHDCGHGEIPHLVEHQRLSAPEKRVTTVYRKHLSDCPRTSPRLSTPPRDFPDGTERKGKGKGEGEPATVAGLRELVKVDPETGGYVYVAPEAKA
jgi:hypothetical protein